ncbi:unnamed protein product [Schistosoma mattheei]|uniref:Uncharacterized protein n=2 Tax=Schistosoma TaxID=6181 RepID=A0A3P7ZAB3_9TREM|nr:unnamed protein product [Schistosoma mattheei]
MMLSAFDALLALEAGTCEFLLRMRDVEFKGFAVILRFECVRNITFAIVESSSVSGRSST